MNTSKLALVAHGVKMGVIKHSPEILTGLGLGGMIMSTILAVRATPKALILLDEKKKEDEVETLSALDTVKVVWKCYIPAVISCGLSIACIIGATSVNLRRNAALAAAYSISETALKEYQEKVVESIGEKKEKVIRDTVAKERLERDPVEKADILVTGNGETLCYDAVTGRYFKSDIEKIRRTVNDLNRSMRDVMYVSLNEFYYAIGLENVSIGDDLGWNIDRGYIDIDFSAQLASNGQPCLVIDHRTPPMYDYRV